MTNHNPSGNLPPNANLEQYKKQAKDLLRSFKTQEPPAIRRFGVHHPKLRKLLTGDLLLVDAKLTDAQIVLASEHGFSNWSAFTSSIRKQGTLDFTVPSDPDERKAAFFEAGSSGDVQVVQLLLDTDPSLVKAINTEECTLMEKLQRSQQWCEGLNAGRRAVYRTLLKAGSPPCLVTAVRANDTETVSNLLAKDPDAAFTVDKRICHASPFVIAADNGHAEIVNLMLDSVTIPKEQIHDGMGRALLYSHFSVCDRLLKTKITFLFDCLGNAEFQNPIGMRWELEHGADPNHNNGAALKLVLSTYGRKIGPKHECIELLLEYGAKWTDNPVMAIHRGQSKRLASFLDRDPDLIHKRYSLDSGVNLSLFDVTLLHIAAEFNEPECVDLLLERGADLNAQAGYEDSGIGGLTPIYHTIGGNQGLVFPLFKQLLKHHPDLTVAANIQHNALNLGQPIQGIEKLTPIAYAERYANGPKWRQSAREAAILMESESDPQKANA